MIGVYIGRFQSFTKTHCQIVDFIASEKDVDKIIIIKGSSQWSDKNPDPNAPVSNLFTSYECCEIIKLSLDARLKKPYMIICIPDTVTKFTDPLWKEWIDSIVAAITNIGIGNKFAVYTRDLREKTAFERVGVAVRPFPLPKNGVRATMVRSLMIHNDAEWENCCVNSKAVDFIRKINGPSRMLRLLVEMKKV